MIDYYEDMIDDRRMEERFEDWDDDAEWVRLTLKRWDNFGEKINDIIEEKTDITWHELDLIENQSDSAMNEVSNSETQLDNQKIVKKVEDTEVTWFSTTPSWILFSVNSKWDGTLPNMSVIIGEDEYFFESVYIGQNRKKRFFTTIPQLWILIKTKIEEIIHSDFDVELTGRSENLETAYIYMLEKFLVALKSQNPKKLELVERINRYKLAKKEVTPLPQNLTWMNKPVQSIPFFWNIK